MRAAGVGREEDGGGGGWDSRRSRGALSLGLRGAQGVGPSRPRI